MKRKALWICFVTITVILADDQCPDECQLPSCICPSTTSPGRFDRDNTPQFVILYTDELMTQSTFSRMVKLTRRHKNLNGCNIPITWYIREHSNADMIRNAFNRYFEIAVTAAAEGGDIQSQITKARDWLVQSSQIPADQIIGFRAPKWSNGIGTRSILGQIGFKYDHSILEAVQNPGERHWPYTMDFGIAEDCSDPHVMCDARERHPGLIEIPVWEFRDRHNKTGNGGQSDVSLGNALSSNPDWASLLAFNFAASFYGNRAPVSIPLSKNLLEDDTAMEAFSKFIGQVLDFENVWIVTNAQLVSYMQTPKDIHLIHELLTCSNRAEENSCLPPKAGCARGTFDFKDCICNCENSDNRNVPGFCIDNYQRCTVETIYSEESKVYYCKDPEPVPTAQPVVYGLGAGTWLILLYVLLAILAFIGLWRGIRMGRRRARLMRSVSGDNEL